MCHPALIDLCNLLPMLHSLSVTASSEAACFIAAVEYDGEVYLTEVDGQEIFPVGRLMPDGQHAAYVRYQLNDECTMLLVSTYKPGSIERKLYKTTETGVMGALIDVNLWPFKTTVWADLVNTGMSVNLITWIPNVMLQGKAFSDYDGSLDQQDNVNSANTQIARILAKHADPMVAFPRDSFREDGTILSSDKAVAKGDTPGSVPEYITWSGELDAAMKNRAFAANALLMTTEMSPVLLGLKEGAAPTAYKSLRLEAVNSISKANRKALYFSVGLKWALIAAQQLENTLDGKGGYAIGPIGVTLRDGIPIDENEQAITITTLTGGKPVMSLERAVSLLIADPAERDAEIARLHENAARSAATITLMNPEPGMGEGGDSQDAGTRGQGDAATTNTNTPLPQEAGH